MAKLTRYILREYLTVFLLTLFGMTVFFLLMLIGGTAVKEGLGVGPILRILPFIIPDSMRFSVPAAALLATCVVFGRMSSDKEIVAIKSVGISPWRLMAPIFFLGFIISVFAVWMNDMAVSWGRAGAGAVITESIEQIAYGKLRTQRSYSTDRFSINVRDVVGHRLILPIMSIRDERGGMWSVSAKDAELRRNPADGSLTIALSDGDGEDPNGNKFVFPGTREYEIESSAINKPRAESPSDFALRAIPGERGLQQQNIRRMEYELATTAAFQVITGDLHGLSAPEWKVDSKQLRKERYRLNRLRTEPWRRWANGFSCFFFMLVGAPWAIEKGQKQADFVSIFFKVFMPILLIYYPLFEFGVQQAKEGALPQYAVWLGNAACALIALKLISNVLKR